MSGIANKVKNAMHSDNSTSTTHTTTTHTTHGNNSGLPEGTVGPHGSRVGNAADPMVDSDLDSSRHTHGAGIGGTNYNTTGQSSLQSHIPGTTGHSTGHSTIGGTGLNSTHKSHVPGTGLNSTHHQNHTGGTHGRNLHNGDGIVDGTSSHQSHNPLSHGTAGVHKSDNLNKLDPTIDSDLSGGNHLGAQSDARTVGYSGTGVHTGNTGLGHSPVGHQSHVGASGIPGSHGTSSGLGSSTHHTGANTTAGPHSSNTLNKADPLVDSDRSNTHAHHTTTTGSGAFSTPSAGKGTHGGISNSTNAGPHNSNLANSADPRIDSDLSGAGGHVGHAQHGLTGAKGSHATPGSGTAQNTAGPHNSDLLNKLDPRVDSDLSGGKTFGGNKTHT